MSNNKSKNLFFDAFMKGLSCSYDIEVSSRHVVRTDPSRDVERLRGYFQTIGKDFNVAIERTRQAVAK